ncbi:bifunctional 2',3'-cyclic-nucleotide 2'-phosphodiesterase/3'-nucleotidase [Salinisphaera sp.]|uniref:bifunctional 2',3'-cyclic-nucleotide 2'-phosphodiesterase/3'-nucleotidase n=1 Tax=Salinisphaera sp. TaxID=1914330 RepID=UPI0025D07F22|nr:bifunctional 2',3'-cyclic-nucleotide 2'-phosphodiesterase/3'-nucleotidase [Salinisphaera sp.]
MTSIQRMPLLSKSMLVFGALALGTVLSGCSDDNDDDTVARDNTGSDSTPAQTATVDFRVMETTDIHANVNDYNYYNDTPDPGIGLVRTATLVHQAREEMDVTGNTMLVDNGDLIQGSPMGDWRADAGLAEGEVHPVYKAMNTLNYVVANYGNHEFNYGLKYLANAVDDANFGYISANIFKDDGDDNPDNDVPYFSPYKLVTQSLTDRDGHQHEITVGFIGFVPPQIMQWDRSNLEGTVITKDIKAMAERYVPEMKEKGADMVVAIAHSGVNTEDYDPAKRAENSSWYLADVKGIDAILMGHAHLVFPGSAFADTPGVDLERGTIKGVPAVMPGFWGDHLGIVDFTLNYEPDTETWRVADAKAVARPIFADGKSLVEADGAIKALIASDDQATRDYMSQPLGESTDDIFSFLALVKDDPSVQIVADAQKAYVENLIKGDVELQDLPVLSAAAPFKACDRNGICANESDFTTVPEGELTLRNAADLYLYPNTLVAVKVSGSELKGWLECSASQFYQVDPTSSEPQPLVNYTGFPTYNFDVIDGVTYQIDVTQPPRFDRSCKVINEGASRIRDLTYNGQPVADDQEFIVATNNYRANGGQFPGTGPDHIVINSPDANRTILADYIRNESPVTPTADGNWRFAPIQSGVDLTLTFRVPNTDRARNFVEEQSMASDVFDARFIRVNDDNERVYELNLQ